MPLMLKRGPAGALHSLHRKDNLDCNNETELQWLNRMYECWQAKASAEELHQELMEVRKQSEEWYDFLTRQLLAWLAGAEDLDTFCQILDAENFRGFCIHAVRKSWLGDSVNQSLKERFPNLVSTLFITEKEEFLDEIVKRSGILRICYVLPREYYADGMSTIQSCLPETWLAVWRGNLHMAEYFRRNRGYGSGTIRKNNSLIQNGFITPDYDLRTNDSMLGDDPNLLILALLSGSKEMVEFVLKHFPDLRWNDQLWRSIMQSRGCISKMILKYHPELLEFVDIVDIFQYRHKIFLDAYLENCRRQEKHPGEEISEADKEELLIISESLHGENIVAFFYRKAFLVFTDKVIRRALLRMLAADYSTSGQRALAVLFSKYRDVECDFTYYLGMMTEAQSGMDGKRCRDRRDSLYELYSRDTADKIPIDLYEIIPEAIIGFSRAEIRKLLCRTRPIKTEDRPDALSHRLLELNDMKLVEEAVDRGFITKRNKAALMKEAQILHSGREIKTILLKIECSSTLTDRYVW